MPRLTRLLTTASLAMLVAGCSGHGERTAQGVGHDLSAAQRQTGYQVYWDGPSFRGLPLTNLSRGAGSTTLIYGTCTPQPAGDEASCTPPLEIELSSIRDRNPLLLDVGPSA